MVSPVAVERLHRGERMGMEQVADPGSAVDANGRYSKSKWPLGYQNLSKTGHLHF